MKNNREIILDTALELFLTKGYSVGVNEIITRANTSKGAFYHHFKSKEELFLETIDVNFFGSIGELNPILTANNTCKDVIIDLISKVFLPFRNIMEKFEDRGDINFLSVFVEFQNNQILLGRIRRSYSKIHVFLKDILQSAVENKEFRSDFDVNTMSLHLMMLVDGAIINSITMFENFNEAEKECKNAISQLLSLL